MPLIPLPLSLASPLLDPVVSAPRRLAIEWPSFQAWAPVAGDIAMAGAYAGLALILVLLASRRKRLLLSGTLWLGGAFLLTSGAMHLVDAMAFARPAPAVFSWIKVVTALIAWAALLSMLRVMPRALELASAEDENQLLEAEIERRRQVEADLRHARDEIEEQRANVVVRERRLRTAMRAAGVCAVRWNLETNKIEWDAGSADVLEAMGLPASSRFASWDDLLTPLDAERLRAISEMAAAGRQTVDTVLHVLAPSDDGGVSRTIRLAARAEPAVAGEARTMSGMFRVVRGGLGETAKVELLPLRAGSPGDGLARATLAGRMAADEATAPDLLPRQGDTGAFSGL